MKDISRNRQISLDVVLAAAVAVGVTAGVILSLGMDEQTLIELGGAGRKLEIALSWEWIRLFINSLSGTAALLCAVFLCGFSAVAQPAEIFIAAFRGLGLGICVRGIYLGGDVVRSMAVFLPFAVLSTWVIIASIKEAFSLSGRYLALSVTDENRLGIRSRIHDYAVKFLMLALLLAALSAIDAAFAMLIAG